MEDPKKLYGDDDGHHDDDDIHNHLPTTSSDHSLQNDEDERVENFPSNNNISDQGSNTVTTRNNDGNDEDVIPSVTAANTALYSHRNDDNETQEDRTSSRLNNNDYEYKSTMSRQSTVSSMAGNSLDLGIDDNDDIEDNIRSEEGKIDALLLKPAVDVTLNMLPNDEPIQSNIIDIQINNNNNATTTYHTNPMMILIPMDERSVRSDRPDPPPSFDIMPKVEHQTTNNNHHHPNETTTSSTEQNPPPEPMIPSHDDTTRMLPQQHRYVTTAEENLAVEALASLSMNMAEMTLLEENNLLAPPNVNDDDDDITSHLSVLVPIDTTTMAHHNTEWDLNRAALLAETPNAVTIRKTTSLQTMPHPQQDHFHNVNDTSATTTTIPYHRSLSVPKIYNDPPATTTSTTTSNYVGADHLMVLPRVDEGNRLLYTHHPPPPPPQYHYQAPQNHINSNHHSIPPPSNKKNNSNMSNHSSHHPHPGNHPTPSSGRRKIRLQLQEEIRRPTNLNHPKKRHTRSTSLLGSIRNSSTRMLRFGGVGGVGSSISGTASSFLSNWENEDNFDPSIDMPTNDNLYTIVDRGHLMIGWFDGTSTFELQQHIHTSVLRKMQQLSSVVGDSSNNKNSKNDTNNTTIIDIEDLRILDESFDPPEDVVLSPYIPDGSQFLLRFGTIKAGKTKKNETRMKMDYMDGTMTPMSIYSGRAPDSPSAAPSPHLDKQLLFNGLNANQLALLNSLNIPTERPMNRRSTSINKNQNEASLQHHSHRASVMSITDKNAGMEQTDATGNVDMNNKNNNNIDEGNEESSKRIDSNAGQLLSEMSSDEDDNADDATMMLHSDDPIEARLREITNLLLMDRKKERYRRYDRQREKRQVVFVVANYFVLFLAIIAISAELQARAPHWIKMMEEHLQNVQNCSENHEALFECVSRGDFAGLIASVVLWLSRSVTTKRIFLFGFDTPKKLWTVVYESLVTSVCWGISYLFIRRGMNPDTRPRFVQKYWKDAVYGSLAGFNAAFLKHILKNLIPEQVVEDALRERQLKIMGWLPSFNFR